MRNRNTKEKRSGIRFFSGLFFLAGLVVLALIGASLGKETYRKKQIQKEIEGLQGEIQKMNQENGDLENLVSYLSTQEFQEKEAREKLNLLKENEKMIVLKKDAQQEQSANEAGEQADFLPNLDSSPNWKKWLDRFFGPNG